MPTENASRPRSVALIGPYGSGKTTLFEALLAAAGAPVRRPSDGRNRVMSTELRLGHCVYLGDAWSILDCPGSVEFTHEAAAALAVVDLAVVVCEPNPDRALTVAPVLRQLEAAAIPHILFVNKIDTLEGSVRETLDALQAQSTRPLVLRQLPIREGEKITGYVDVVAERAYRYRKGQEAELISRPATMTEPEQAARNALMEVLADHDDALMEKILEDVIPTREEIFSQLHKDIASDAVVEVLLGAAEHENGVRRLWKALRHDVPLAMHTAENRGIGIADAPMIQIFKTQYAGHTGKLSYARIWRNVVRDGAMLNGERLGGIYRFPGTVTEKVATAIAGDIVALGRLEQAATGAVIGSGPTEFLMFPTPPAPVYAMALQTADRKDDVKLSGALHRLQEEDASLHVIHDQGTGETILAGQGELHLHAAVERLAKAYNLKLITQKPTIAYRETIRKPVHQHARLKRQTGGHGQFADVKLDIAPRPRGEGFIFYDKIVGGAVPRQYIPAVGEAAAEAARKGPFGYPVVDISVTLVDGTFHAVDSSEMAFKTATRMAMTDGLAQANPVLLEPIQHVTVTVPNEFTARAQRLLTGRRGQILGFQEKPDWPGWDAVEALVPAAELQDLIIDLRSQTLGLGSYVHQFNHLAEAARQPA